MAFNLSVTAQELNSAVANANAAAPQSTTYTKSETDTLLAGKVDKETGKGLSTNDFTTTEKNKLSGIEQGATKTVIDTALSSTSTNPVQNKAVQAPVVRLVDAGAKNLLKITATSQTINGVTFTVNDDGTVSVDGTNNTSTNAVFYLSILPADTAPNYNGCRLTGCPRGGSGSTYRLAFQLNSDSYSSYASDIGSGSTIRNAPSSDCRVAIIIYPGITANNMIFEPMICTAEDYAISTEFVPYAPSNRELYEEVEGIENTMQVSSINTIAFSTLSAYVDTLSNGVHSFFVPNNNQLTDVPMNNSNAIVTAKVYNENVAVLEFVAVSVTYQMHRYSKIKSAGVWRDWYRFDGTAVT